LELTNIINDIFEKYKNSKITTKTSRNQKFKHLKMHIRRPQIKNFKEQNIVRIENIKNNIFQHFKNPKITPKHPKNQTFNKF